jgi:hypothetical protein
MSWKNPFEYTKEEKELSDTIIRRRKTIRHLLTPHQKLVHDFLFNSKDTEMGFYCSRKVGKTGSSLLNCYEFAWKNPGCLVRFVLADLTQAKLIIEPMLTAFIDKIIPTDMLPRYLKSEHAMKFKNGSMIKLNGANPDVVHKAVGPSCDLFVFDEIAIWEGDVKRALLDIFYPQGTLTGAKRIFSCTPPDDISSYYIQEIHPRLSVKNKLITLTIYENPLLTAERITQIEDDMGGKDSPEFRRQYLCELIPNNESRIVPEFNEDKHVYTIEKDKCVEYGEQRIPQLYQYFICADTATDDNTAILVGYFDHHNQKLVIEEEYVKNNINLTEIAIEINRLKDKYLPYCFDGDKNLKIIIDGFSLERKEYREMHGIQHSYPIKGKVEENIAHLRSGFVNEKIEINDKCERLKWELKNCVWKKTLPGVTKQIDRNERQKHGDAIMALTYIFRAVNWRFRPEGIEYNIKLDGYNPKINKLEDMKSRTTIRTWGNIS